MVALVYAQHSGRSASFDQLSDVFTRRFDHATARVEVPVDRLGLAAPPVFVRFQLLGTPGRRTLVGWTEPGRARDLAPWALVLEPVAMRFAPLDEPRVAAFDVRRLPRALEAILGNLFVRQMELSPGGAAVLNVEGPSAAISALRSGEEMVGAAAELRPDADLILTTKQTRALQAALEAGYYDLPRRIRLVDLARDTGTSAAALSELLRRAEAKLVRRYVAEGAPAVNVEGFELP